MGDDKSENELRYTRLSRRPRDFSWCPGPRRRSYGKILPSTLLLFPTRGGRRRLDSVCPASTAQRRTTDDLAPKPHRDMGLAARTTCWRWMRKCGPYSRLPPPSRPSLVPSESASSFLPEFYHANSPDACGPKYDRVLCQSKAHGKQRRHGRGHAG